MSWHRLRRKSASRLDALAAEVLSGSEASTDEFLRGIAPLMLRIARQVMGASHPDLEDVVQEALVGTMDALPRFRGECSIKHFVRRIGLLTALNARRRLQLREQIAPLQSLGNSDVLPGRGESPAEDVEAESRRARFSALLDELPPPQAEALGLHCVLGYSVAETAALSGVPINTIRGRLVTAKSVLRRRLEADTGLQEVLRGVS